MKLFLKLMLCVVFILSTVACPPIFWAGQLSTLFASTHQDVGTNGAQSLEVELGVRPAGMGGAFVAVADDTNAIHWNPTGLSQVKNVELNSAQLQHFEDIKSVDIGLIYPLDEMHSTNIKSLGTLGFNVSLFDLGDFVGRDETGTSTGNFSSKDRILNVSYGKYLTETLSLGVSGKFVTEEIDTYKAQTYAFDIGGLYNTVIENFTLGFCVQNLSNQIKFV